MASPLIFPAMKHHPAPRLSGLLPGIKREKYFLTIHFGQHFSWFSTFSRGIFTLTVRSPHLISL